MALDRSGADHQPAARFPFRIGAGLGSEGRMRIFRSAGSVGMAIARLSGLALLVALLAVRIADPVFLSTLRSQSFDVLQRLHPRPYAAAPVVIVDIERRASRRWASGRGRDRGSRPHHRLTPGRHRHRLRHRLCRTRPPVARPHRRGQSHASGKRRRPACWRCRRTRNCSPTRSGARASWSARPACARARASRRPRRPRRRRSSRCRMRPLAPIPNRYLAALPAARAKRQGHLRGGRRARGVHRRPGSRRHFPPHAAGHGRRGQDACSAWRRRS